MSAIFGILHLNQQPLDTANLQLMQQALNHWNADDTGVWHSEQVGLGHLMLWNTPESLQEKLPLHHTISNCTITADARIDNREDLFKKLAIDAALQQSIPDSSLIIEAYEKYGKDCVQHLIGDFAFAIWDANKQQLFCARDHMGVKPFFYYKDDHVFAFASEKKGLLALQKQLPAVAVIEENYLLKIAGGIKPVNYWETLYKNIFRLKTAHTFIIKGKQTVEKRYWELDIYKKASFKSSSDYVEGFKEKFASAINNRIRSANLVATELSGGLDSSGITCVAASLLHQQNKKIASFSLAGTKETAIYHDHEERDNELISEVHNFAKIDIPIILNDSGYKHWLEEIDLILNMHDGPEFCNTIWSLPLKKNAALAGTKTILSGFGGDELVTNFSTQYYLDALSENDFLLYWKQVLQEVSYFRAFKIALKNKFYIVYSFLNKNVYPRKKYSPSFNPKKNFLKEDFFIKIKEQIKNEEPHFYNFKAVQKNMIEDSFHYLRVESENLASYQYRIETRFPMLDVPLMEYVLSLPAKEKMQHGKDRFLFRNAMKGLMPNVVLSETEYTGFSKPYALHEWLQTQNDKASWIKHLKENNQIPSYLNLEEIYKGYKFTKDAGQIKFFAVRKQIESIIKFFNK